MRKRSSSHHPDNHVSKMIVSEPYPGLFWIFQGNAHPKGSIWIENQIPNEMPSFSLSDSVLNQQQFTRKPYLYLTLKSCLSPSLLEKTEERISELEERTIQITKLEQKRKNKLKDKTKQKPLVSTGEEKGGETKRSTKEVTDIFPNWAINLQNQEAEWISYKINP